MQAESIMIATQNTRSLGRGFLGRKKRKEIKNLFYNTTPPTDVLLLQEVKLPESACLKQARFVEFKGGSSLWNKGTFSAHSGRFKGGTGIVLSPRMASRVTHHGILYPGRMQYIVVNITPQVQLGITNVYGFSHTSPRAMMWNHLAQTTFPEATWVLACDFNNIESVADKQGGSTKTSIGPRELETWNRMLLRLGECCFQECAILSKWARVGDRCTKEFFEFHEGPRNPVSISMLMDGNRSLTTQAEIEKHILDFYIQLYRKDDQVEDNEAARTDCFQYVNRTVTEAHNLELLRPITTLEVTEVIKQLPTGKSPGVDAIPTEFYKEMWPDIEFEVFNFISEAISQAFIEGELNISKIALLPKSEDRSKVHNFRPISLLNTAYKILAKVYANRMKPLWKHANTKVSVLTDFDD